MLLFFFLRLDTKVAINSSNEILLWFLQHTDLTTKSLSVILSKYMLVIIIALNILHTSARNSGGKNFMEVKFTDWAKRSKMVFPFENSLHWKSVVVQQS